MIIHYLRASGFKIMGEPIELSFPDEGRIGILGQNECGKTTLFQVIESALYGLRKGSGVEGERENLVTWGKNEARLEIEFTSGQNRYNLQRVIGTKSGHRATLTSVLNGSKDRSSSVTGLTDVETKIEQITGMDRDSFTKLVYIRQKDLDALKELAKSKREQLVNKVMGIDLFDDASAKVKNEISGLEDEFEKMDLRLSEVRRNKQEYEAKQKQKAELETQTLQLQNALDEKKRILDETKTLLVKYDWLNNYSSANEAISLLKRQQEQVTKDIERMADLQKKLESYRTTLSKHKPEYVELKTMLDNLSNLERRLIDAETLSKSIETKRQTNIEKLGFAGKDAELLSKDLPKKKNQQLAIFGLLLVSGLVALFSAFFTTLIVAIIGALLLGAAAYVFTRYLKIDKLIVQNAETDSLTRQLLEQEKTNSSLRKDMETLTVTVSFKTSQEVKDRLSAISEEMVRESGEGTLEGIEAVQRSTEKSLEPLQTSNIEQKKQNLEQQIQEKKLLLEELARTKPASVDEIQYNKREHELVKDRCDNLRNEYGAIDKDIGTQVGTSRQLTTDLQKLKSDYDEYPQLDKNVQDYKAQIDLLRMVLVQLSETSKELRNKVIPHARFIINQILPTLTADRYSDFEITEDLKFKVHSTEAGGYKEREVFSGGTQDQFLIALRLAFTQSILDSRVMADKYSLLMDECTSSSDDVRKQGIFEVLDAMKQTFSQIFIIAHEDIATFVDNHIVLDRNKYGYTEIKSKSW